MGKGQGERRRPAAPRQVSDWGNAFCTFGRIAPSPLQSSPPPMRGTGLTLGGGGGGLQGVRGVRPPCGGCVPASAVGGWGSAPKAGVRLDEGTEEGAECRTNTITYSSAQAVLDQRCLSMALPPSEALSDRPPAGSAALSSAFEARLAEEGVEITPGSPVLRHLLKWGLRSL